jgi:hypothetical protein
MIRLLATLGALLAASTPTPQPPGGVQVSLDQERISASIGQVLTLDTTVTNPGSAPTDRLIAHLNVASLDGIYVDLEDWSGDVTRVVEPIPAGGDASVEWEFQAVNTGNFDVYVVLLPGGSATAGRGPLVASPPVHVTVAPRQELNSGGALPVTIAVPVLLGLGVLATTRRRRRTA